MSILSALGVNETVGIQFFIFLIVYFSLSRLLFTPYFSAFLKRSEKTVGNTDRAEQLQKEAAALEQQFQNHAREQNQRLKSLFEAARAQAQREYEGIAMGARDRATLIIDETRQKTLLELQRVQPDLKNEVVLVTSGIVQKMLGKDLAG
jgi:F0F1-type ATP synthase membrane subunit b/b'